MIKENLSAIVLSIAIIVAAILIRPGAQSFVPFQISSEGGVVYRLNQISGRIDVLVPTSEGALMMPVGQISPPNPDKMTEDDRKQFSSFLKTVAQYVQGERDKSLGLPPAKIDPSAAAAPEVK